MISHNGLPHPRGTPLCWEVTCWNRCIEFYPLRDSVFRWVRNRLSRWSLLWMHHQRENNTRSLHEYLCLKHETPACDHKTVESLLSDIFFRACQLFQFFLSTAKLHLSFSISKNKSSASIFLYKHVKRGSDFNLSSKYRMELVQIFWCINAIFKSHLERASKLSIIDFTIWISDN